VKDKSLARRVDRFTKLAARLVSGERKSSRVQSLTNPWHVQALFADALEAQAWPRLERVAFNGKR